MKVLVVCAAGIVSGKEIMSLLLLRQLKARGNSVYCAVSSWGSLDYRERLSKEGIGFEVLRMGFISKTLTWSAVRMTLVQVCYLPALWLGYLRMLRNVKPDIIIHTNFHHVFLLLPFLKKRKSWYWSHEVIGNTIFYGRLFRTFEKRLLGFICVSEVVANSLRYHGLRNIVVVNNGIELPREMLPVTVRGKITSLGIVGQVSAHKGHEILIEALAKLPPKSWKLRIVGKGLPEYEMALCRRIEELGCTSGCEWLGFVKDVDLIYSGLDVLVVPSVFSDPYPTTVMEAGVRGIVVVGSTSGGIPEMIQQGVNGYLFPTGDPVALRDILHKLIESRNYRQHGPNQMSLIYLRHI